jgi:hypothetical protein
MAYKSVKHSGHVGGAEKMQINGILKIIEIHAASGHIVCKNARKTPARLSHTL